MCDWPRSFQSASSSRSPYTSVHHTSSVHDVPFFDGQFLQHLCDRGHRYWRVPGSVDSTVYQNICTQRSTLTQRTLDIILHITASVATQLQSAQYDDQLNANGCFVGGDLLCGAVGVALEDVAPWKPSLRFTLQRRHVHVHECPALHSDMLDTRGVAVDSIPWEHSLNLFDGHGVDE